MVCISSGGFSTAHAKACVICCKVTRASRCAPSRVAGNNLANAYNGISAYGQLRPGPSTYQGRTKVARHATLADQPLTFGACRLVLLHDRRRPRNAEIDEMAHAGFDRRMHRFLARLQIDGAKFGGLPWIGMRYPNQVHEGIGWRYLRRIAFCAQRVAAHRLAASHQLRLRAWADQRAHVVSPAQ